MVLENGERQSNQADVHESSSGMLTTINKSALDDAIAFFTAFVLEDDLLQPLQDASMGRDQGTGALPPVHDENMGRDQATGALPPVHDENKSDRESDQTIDEIATSESILVCNLDILEATLDCTLDFLEPLDFDLIDRGLSTANTPNATLIPKHTNHDQSALDSTAVGTEEAKTTFNQVDIFKSNKTVSKDSILDEAVHFFESFEYVAPFDGP
jgi:hypothetical protein